jgi:hypothetical protein
VPPAYGDFSLALVLHSNEGGPGPRHNMKEDPGSSTLIMKREHGQEVPCDPGQVIRILGCTSPPLPLPPLRATRAEPPFPPPSGTYSTPCQSVSWGQPRRKTHFSLWFEVGGHGLGKRRMWRPFWAFQHLSRRSDSRASDQRRLTSALLYSATL